TAARRLWTALVAILLAALCKEPAALLALMLPWVPGKQPMPRSERAKWVLATAGAVLLWGSAYWAIRHNLSRLMPWDFGEASELNSRPLPYRYGWALVHSFRDSIGISTASPAGTVIVWLIALLGVAGLFVTFRDRARVRALVAWPWILFGLAW